MKYETDSRKVKKGQIFVALKGHTVDGHDFIPMAIAKGAQKIVAEKKIEASIPVEVVTSTQEYLKNKLVTEYAPLLETLTIVGVTGTNGKTTSCYLTYQLLQKLGVKVAYLGTIGFYYEDKFTPLENTTPDILTLYNLLLDVQKLGCTHIIMEVSSHSLYYERIAGLKLKIAAFTNLTLDHLDFHKTMENYLNEKLKILNYLTPDGIFIGNADDTATTKFLKERQDNLTLGYQGDYRIIDFNFNPMKTNLTFTFKNKEYHVTYNLTSKFNVYNYLTALAIVNNLGFKIEDILNISAFIKAPQGRSETYEVKKGFVVIDYAHTPDAVEKIISAYQEMKKGRIITLLGCGGDRDPKKRPIMGQIATCNSDLVIFTNDNPRCEDPKDIMKDILKGVKKDNYKIIYDRREAIKYGLDNLKEHDILLILGKGHEDYQIIGHEKFHLSDKEEVFKYLKVK